jgi:hypothetical protein
MRRTRRRRALVAVLGTALLMSVAGTGTSAAQEHDDHPHPTTTSTTTPTTPTTTPTTPTTRPPSTSTTSPPQPGSQTTNIRYGPFGVQGAPANPDGTHGHAHTGNQFSFFIQKPCTNCYITGMTADLVYADGRQAGWSTDAQLHHMVLFNQSWGRSDATCSASFLGFLGQRFFASGDERTPVIAPPGYGYYTGIFDSWHMIWELANHNSTPQNNLYISMKWQWVPASTPGMRTVEPVWLDVNQCGTSQISLPAGPSERTYSWTVNRPGRVIGAGGHVHDGGINIATRNTTTGQMICDSVARYGGSPLYTGHHGEQHLSGMSTCTGTRAAPVATLTQGQRVTITGRYNMPAAVTDQMGIVLLFIDQTA